MKHKLQTKKSVLIKTFFTRENVIENRPNIVYILVDGGLLILAYFLINFYKRNTFFLDSQYVNLLLLYLGIWGLTLIFGHKYELRKYHNLKSAFLYLGRYILIFLYTISLILILSGTYNLSRIQLFGSGFLYFAFELFAVAVVINIKKESTGRIQATDLKTDIQFRNFSLSFFMLDGFWLTISFFIMYYFKRNTLNLTEQYEDLIFIMYGVWLVGSLSTRKFYRKKYRNVYYAIAPYVKSFLIMIAISAVLVYAFQLFYYSRLQIFGALSLLMLFEAITIYIYYISGLHEREQRDIEDIREVKDLLGQEELPFELEKIRESRSRELVPVSDKLKKHYLKNFPKIFEFIHKNLNLNKIDEHDVSVLNTHTQYNIEVIEDHSVSLLVNLHKLNDFRWLNRYFLEVHKKIYNGGWFIGCVETIHTHRARFYRKYSRFLAQMLYPLEFLFVRVLPKLPGIRKIYFVLTGGKNRVFSMAEILGRLYFCGFRIVQTEVIDDCMYYIAQRVKTPSLERNPSYGPLIKLRRVGYQGELLYVNKFRTMHPYSEYLQEYIHEQHALNSRGKFANDFRLTGWGVWFRRMWIDELPQIINFFRGDLSLVGVRAISEHYFSLYPKELQQLRIQFKPGLVPPYYADMPKTFDEIIASETKYLHSKQIHPFTTDVRYFFKAAYNILFRHARSQ